MSSKAARAVLLFGHSNRKVDACLTALAALIVGWSRFAWLANGPWEWDETLFARGILHFELAAHFPHPPGFPGWLALGHLLTMLTGDPLLALQIASAAFSVAALWVLSHLGRSVAPPAIATLAALAVLAAPGPWLYAVRGFSSTAASVLALAAGAVLAGGLRGRRVTLFTLLITASFLVRPILLPPLAVLWVAGAATVRPLRRLFPGVAMGLAAIIGSVLVMVHAEGGWKLFGSAFARHSQRHFSRLVDNPGGFAELGLIKGLGGVLPASVVVSCAAVGLLLWARRRGRASAVVWLAVLVVSIAQLLLLQNRTYGRYAVGVQMASAPLVAAAASAVPAPLAVAGLVAAGGWYGAVSQPLVAEQHRTRMPGWRAVQSAHATALERGWTVVLEPELHPFASYLWHLRDRDGAPNPAWTLSPWAPEPWRGVSGPWVVATVHRHLYPDPIFGIAAKHAGVSTSLEPLTQQRFLEAWVLHEPPLPVTGWWPAERTPGGRRFMWGGADAQLLVPPLSMGSTVGLAVRPAPGPAPLQVEWQDRSRAVLAGDSDEHLIRLQPMGAVGEVARLTFSRATVPQSTGRDPRPLAVQLFELRAVDPLRHWRVNAARRHQLAAIGVFLEGAYPAEVFGGGRRGSWLSPEASVTLPVVNGAVALSLSAPRPTAPRTTVWLDGRRIAGPLDLGADVKVITVGLDRPGAPEGHSRLEIRSAPFVPLEVGLPDRRELGVVLGELAFAPPEGDLDGPAAHP